MLERIHYNNPMAEGNTEIPVPPKEHSLDTKEDLIKFFFVKLKRDLIALQKFA